MRRTGAAWLLGLAMLWPAAASTVTLDVLGPRPLGVLDHAGVLDAQSEAGIRSITAQLRLHRAVDVVVVAVRRVDGTGTHAFATALFERWKLGGAMRDDGVLLLVAVEQRAVELINGDGIDDAWRQGIAREIVDERVLPQLRAGNAQAALLGGSQAIASRMFGMTAFDPEAVERIDAPTSFLARPGQRISMRATAGDAGRDAVQAARIGGPARVDARMRGAAATHAKEPRSPGIGLGWWVFAAGVLAVMGWLGRAYYRSGHCRHCGAVLRRLAAGNDEAHLAAHECTERRIGSVVHEVWACTACPHVDKRRDRKWFTAYLQCPQCHAIANEVRGRVLTEPSYEADGMQELTENCAHCGRHAVGEHRMPRLRSSRRGRTFVIDCSNGKITIRGARPDEE